MQESDRLVIAAAAGMGGIGKTELAWQYADQRRSDFVGGIWWIAAGVDRVSQILIYSQRMGLLEPPETHDTDRAKVQWCYEQWLKQLPEGRRLLVFDDVAEYGVIREVLPQDGRFRVLLTTREKLGQPVRRLDLGVLKRSAAFRLLRRLVGDDRIGAEVEAAKALCAWMGQLPLGIELVGRYLANRSALRLEKLLERLEAQKLAARAVREVPAEMPYQANLAAAFELSWQGLSLDARQVGGLLGGFALAPVAHGWVVASLPEWEEERVEDGLAELERGSLLTVERLLSGENQTGYLLHALIRAFFAAKLETELAAGAEGLRRGMAQALTEVAKTIPQTVTLGDLARVEGAIPHLAVVAENWTHLLISSVDVTRLFIGLARIAKGENRWQDAEILLTKCLSISEDRFGYENPDTGAVLNALALLYQVVGRYGEAELFYRRALQIAVQNLGSDHSATVDVVNNLATLYQSMGRYKDAEPLFQQALKVSRQTLGSNHPDIAISLNNLASLYKSQGRYDEAEPLFQEALELNQHTWGRNNPNVATSLHNLAELYYLQKRYDEAETKYDQALSLRRQLLGDLHLHTIISLSNLALLHLSCRRYGKAKPMLREALELNKQVLGIDHPYVATLLNNLAGLYFSQGQYNEAESLFKQALELRQRISDTVGFAISLYNLAGLNQARKRYNEAESLYGRALQILLRTIGREHPNTMQVWNGFRFFVQQAFQEGRSAELSDHPLTQAVLREFDITRE